MDETLDAERLGDYIVLWMPVNIPMVSEGAYIYGNYRIIPLGNLDHTLLGRRSVGRQHYPQLQFRRSLDGTEIKRSAG
ncbi:uncharacterized protein METZ01_LOCUS193099 [marine metagenome]|uniref:Uncharacterized protein n=1 Tax=marine metagenome TaxID=408172 RepID=A0A382DPV5_9ZZZZ